MFCLLLCVGSMSFTQEDLNHLKKLARIQFDRPEKEKAFFGSIKDIIAMLEELQSFDLGDVQESVFLDKTMDVHQWQVDFNGSDALLANVTHPIINNSIVVKSVLGED